MEGMVEAKQWRYFGDAFVECGRVGGRVRL